jgi:hypothetical protein
VNILWRWRKKIEEETDRDIQEGRQAAKTGDQRLREVREITRKGEDVRKKSKHLQNVNQFVSTFMKALEEGMR